MLTKGICRKTSAGELWKLHFNRAHFTLHGNDWQLVVSSRELNSPGVLGIPNDRCAMYVFSSTPLGSKTHAGLTYCLPPPSPPQGDSGVF